MSGYASRIPNIFCLKFQKIEDGRAIQAPASRVSPIWYFGWLGRQELVQPFNIFGILMVYPITLRSQFCCTFQLYQIPDQRTVFQYLNTCSLCDSSGTGQTTLLKIIQLRGSCQNGTLADPVEKISFENPFRLHSTNDFEPQ